MWIELTLPLPHIKSTISTPIKTKVKEQFIFYFFLVTLPEKFPLHAPAF